MMKCSKRNGGNANVLHSATEVYPLIAIDVAGIFPVERVETVRDQKSRNPLLAVCSSLRQYSSYLMKHDHRITEWFDYRIIDTQVDKNSLGSRNRIEDSAAMTIFSLQDDASVQ